MAETKCQRTPCENPAAYRVFWPNQVIGVHEPMLLCAPCAESDAAWRGVGQMTQAEFHDALRILISISLQEMQDVSLFNGSQVYPMGFSWPVFDHNPSQAFLSMPLGMAEKVWSIVERRMRRSGPSVGQTALPDDAS